MIRLTKRRLLLLAACVLLVWVSFGAMAAANTVDPSSADDVTLAFEPPDTFDCAGYELTMGTNWGETLFGGNGSDCVVGLGGGDVIFGGNGKDRLFGGDGNDTIFGGNSTDYIDGGPGFDTCFGDFGNDTIVNCEIWVQ